jgi:predicted AlkP superfamily pyrophosphatase or phosphodiesterase
MLNDHTLSRFQALGQGLVKPIHEDYAFAAIGPTIEYLMTGVRRGSVLAVDCFGGQYPRPKRLVTILVDAFGFEFWQRFGARSKIMRHMLRDGVVTPVSALFPSTTAASISTLNLGVPPAAHALYEWNIYIPAYGETIQSLAFATLGPEPVPCERLGYDPRALLTVHETIHTRLARAGVTSIQLAHQMYAHSAYNGIIGVGANVRPHTSLEDALSQLRGLLATPPTRPEVIGFYWAGLDTTAHMVGPQAVAFEQEVLAFWAAMDAALHGLEARDTLFLITADHGHVGSSHETFYINAVWPQLNDWLATSSTGQTIWPNGSPRDMFLHLKPDHRDEALALLRHGLAERALVLTADDAIAAGLFGTQPVHPELRRRLGDIVILPVPGQFIWWAVPGFMGNPFAGHHGGLSREEMTTVVAVSDRL